MNIKNVSFTGAISVTGSQEEISKINQSIENDACLKSGNKILKGFEKYPYEKLSQQNGVITFLTACDAQKYRDSFKESNMKFPDAHGHIQTRTFELPDIVHSAAKIINAIKEGSFDIKNLKFIK